MAEELGVDIEKLWRWERDAEYASRVSLDQPVDRSSDLGATPEELLANGGDPQEAEVRISRQEEIQRLREEILNLKEQERIVLSLYYFEELKLHEIATVLGVTESRVSQIRTKAIANLRVRLGGLAEDLCA